MACALDMTGRTVGELVVKGVARHGGYGVGVVWLCACRKCGHELERPGASLRKTLSNGQRVRCPACRKGNRPIPKTVTAYNYRLFLSAFDDSQKARVERIVRGRHSPTVLAEAVDLVMRGLDFSL